MARTARLLFVLVLSLGAVGVIAPAVQAHAPHLDVVVSGQPDTVVRGGCIAWTVTITEQAGIDWEIIDIELHFPQFTRHGANANGDLDPSWDCPDPATTFEEGQTDVDQGTHGQAGGTFILGEGFGPVLPAGGQFTFEYDVQVCALLACPQTAAATGTDGAAPIGHLIKQHAHVVAQSIDSVPSEVANEDSNEVSTIVVGEANLGVTKTGPATAQPGDAASYSIAVSNAAGKDPAINAQLSDTLPANFVYSSATTSQGTCSEAGGVVSCDLDDINGGQTVNVTINGSVGSGCDDLSNTASVTSGTPEPNPDPTSNSGTATTDVKCADLSITKTAPSSAASGQTFAYSITVTNNGPDTSTSATVSDTLPTGVTFVAAGSSAGCAENSGVVTCPVGSLANGGSASITINVQSTALGQVCNTASVTGSASETDPDSSDDTSSPAACTTIGRIVINSVDVKEMSINLASNKQGVVNVKIMNDPSVGFVAADVVVVTTSPGTPCFGANSGGRTPEGGDCTPSSPRLQGGTLQLKYDIKEANLQLGDTQACVAGVLTDGRQWIGCDTINVV